MNKPTKRDEVRLLLIQVRKDQLMKLHEITCFETSGNLADYQLAVHDLLEGPLSMEQLSGIHGIIVGGSGDFSVLDEIPNLDSLEAAMREARRRHLPVLGCSWGGQVLARIFGGQVIHDHDHREVGTVEIRLTTDAALDPLFEDMPEKFLAQVGHKDRIAELPPDAVRLAASDQCPIQAYTFPGTDIYGVQFHPELGRDDLAMRLSYYKKNYLSNPDAIDQVMAGLKDTPEAAGLVGRWVDVTIMKK